jgi:hypothetical protein
MDGSFKDIEIQEINLRCVEFWNPSLDLSKYFGLILFPVRIDTIWSNMYSSLIIEPTFE